MTHYDSTARVPFAKGGKVDKKPIKPKRIILWKGKVKDWPGAQKAKDRTGKQDGGKIQTDRREFRKEQKRKWIAQPGKKRKTAKRRTTSGRTKINPQWLEKKYNVELKAEGGIISLKKGGKADKKWIQGVNKSIKARGTKGVCTGKKFGSASCKPGSKRYNLAKTFKKMARSKHASGGLVRYI